MQDQQADLHVLRQAERRLQRRAQRLADERSHLEALLAHERVQLEQQRAETLMLEQQVTTLLCFQCFQQEGKVMNFMALACSGTLLHKEKASLTGSAVLYRSCT